MDDKQNKATKPTGDDGRLERTGYAMGDRVTHKKRGVKGTVETVFLKGTNPDSKTVFVIWDDGISHLYNEKEIEKA